MTERRTSRADAAGAAPRGIAGIVEQWAEDQPRAPLVVYGEWRLAYRDVNLAANRLAHRLMALGVGPGVRVGLCLDRGPDLLVAILAVMKAGGAFVPLDPHWPADRLMRMRDIAAPAVIVARTGFLDCLGGAGAARLVDLDRDQALIAAGSSANPAVAIGPADTCYVLFTSGSTGTPKGVPVTHGNLANLFPPLKAALDLGPGDTWTWYHSASFGFSIWELLGALLHGGCLVVVPEHIRQDPAALGDLVVDEGVTVFSQTPSAGRRLLGDERFHARVRGSRLRWFALSGEAVRRDDVAAWLRQGHAARLINTYAITETAGQLTLRVFGAGDDTEEGARNLGAPLPGREVLVLDEAGRPVADGTPGELWVGGDCVTPGYLGAPELAGRFPSLAVPGRGVLRGYLTGDRVRRLAGGALEYLGRVDAQLKFRGHRIEPGDIEAALRGHPAVRDAAVGLGTDGAGNQRLTAWVVGGGAEAAVPAGKDAPEFWPSLGAYGIYDPWLYGLMNAEPVRLAAYRAAFAAAAPGKVVLDIGTGADAVLARLAVEAGAAHVYAVEVLPDAAERARTLVASLGLADRITVLEGDIAAITLPRPVDVCTQGIIGNIGSADGIAPLWNAARRLFAPGCVPVPSRCVTRIAPLELPAATRADPRFGPVAADYARRVLASAGQPFDLRLCLRNVRTADLLGDAADFEVLDFHGELPVAGEGSAELTVTRAGLLDGCLLWTVVTAAPGATVDYFREQQAWLPVFIPLGDEPLAVRAGERLRLEWSSAPDSDPLFPDYRLAVTGPDGARREHVSRHRGLPGSGDVGSTRLHRSLFRSVQDDGASPAAPLSVTELRRWLDARLPEHLVPQSWVFLPELPLGPGGKLDRDALPAPGAARPRLAGPDVPPRTPAEAALAALWGEVLGLDRPGVEDDFFELGGDSIAAVQLTTRLQRWLDAGVPLAALFEQPTVAGLAGLLAERFGPALAAALERAAPAPAAVGPAPAAAGPRRVPLTFSQRSLAFLESLYPGDTSASEQFAIRVTGGVDTGRLERAFADLCRRHPILTAAIDAAAGECVLRPDGTAPFRTTDAGDDAGVLAVAEAELRTPFDLATGPLVRAVLCATPAAHVLVVTAHHIGADGLSVPALVKDLAALYAGTPLPAAPAWAELAAQPAWQAGDTAGESLDWWRTQLAGLPPPVLGELVAPPPGARRSRRVAFALEPALADDLRRLARTTGATPFMVLLAAFRTLLFRLTGREDLPVGTPMTLRDDAALDGLVGCLVNPVVLRGVVAGGQSFRELVQAERTSALAALQRGRVPFATVVEAVAPGRRLGEHPLFQVLFSWEPAAPALTTPDGAGFEPVSLPAARSSYFDLECGVRDAGEGGRLAGHLAWSTTVLEDWVAEQLPGLFATLVAGLVAGPDRPVGTAPLLPAALRSQVVTAWNATAAPPPVATTLHEMFLARANRAADGVAVRDGATVLTAGGLADRSAALGAALLARDVAGRNVGVAIGRSADLVVAVLAVLRAGGTVVPLDPGFPAARLAFMARDAELALLLVAGDGGVAPPAGTPVLDVARWRAEAQPAAPVAWPAVPAEAPAMMLYTSGSTGEPKGALTTHAGAVNRVHWLARREGPGPDAGEVFALRTSLNFIDAWWEIFGALAHGVPLQVVPDDVATDPARLPGFLAATGVTRLVLVPSLLAALLEQLAATGARLPALRGCITSGEPLPPALVAEARRLLPGMAILNTYGTSEIWDATAFDVGTLPADAVRVPIGRPIANTRVYVTDEAGGLLPPGIPGELRVAGPGVGPGYWRRPALTAEKFVVMDLPGGASERVYRTGDRARFLADGTVEVLGRLDAQFKLRGQRIEPAEIEQALASHPGVAAAVVGLVGEGDAATLAAGVVPAAGWSPPGDVGPVLAAHLAALLPGWMVPTAWVLLEALPLTPTGKRDRRAGLAAAVAARPAVAAGEAPLTATEQRLAPLWCAVLGVAAVGRDDDFFHRGGHSLLAARLLARVRATFGVEPGLRALFTAPTLAGFAAAIDAAAATADAPPVLAPESGESPVLSHGQERLWFLEQLDPGSPAYHVAWTIRCDGPLDRDALAAALSALVARHAALRTRFPAEGGRPAVVVGSAAPVPLEDHDLRAATDVDGELARRLRALARQPFDLARGPLFRAALLRTGDAQHHLLLVIHHIVTDATSNHVLFGELADLLAGRPLPAPAADYLDFARRQRAGADTPPRQADLAWWRRQLAGAPAALELPTDRPRPAEQRFAGAWLRRPVPATLAAGVERLARERGCTPFMVLLAAFKAVLHRYSGAADVLVGTPVEGRLDVDVERTVGLFINTLVLRTDLAGDPDFATLLARLRETTLAAQARQQAPFEQLVEVLAPERSLARNPVFQVMFNRLEVPEPVRRAGALELCLDQLVDPGISSFDLTLTAASAGGRLALTVEYATALFDAATVEELADAYLALLAAAVADPALPVSRLPLLAPDRRAARLRQGRGAAAAPVVPVPDAVAAVARDRPAAIAVTLGDDNLAYGELDDRAARLAGHLLARGLRRGDRVGVCLPRGPDYLVAVLGVLKAGAAYVPLDPDYPPDRLAALAADAGLAALVVDAATRGLPGPALRVDLDADAAALAATPPAARVAVAADDLAYVLYTSGSTGRPKGVRVTHGSLANALAGWRADYGLVPGETHLQMAGAAFDVFTGDWVRALGSGGRLLICPRDVLLDPPALLGLLRAGPVAVAEFVPAVMRLLVAHVAATGGRLPPLRLFIVGSDTWHGSELAALRAVAAPGTRVINSYGVAEATIDSTWFEAGDEPVPGALPVGRPFPGVTVYVLDGHGAPLPLGVPGELCIGGAGVAAGYLGDEELTARKFVPDPHAGEPGARLYRTGDRARWRARGQLELLGRADAQFKLRGLRIEPAEVEAALAALPGVAAAAVALAGSGDEARLVAFVVAGEGDADAWRAALRRVLPAHLVPAAFVVLPALPLTPNGKVDRAALAGLPVPAGAVPVVDRAADGSLEATLCALCAELLGVPAVGPGTDFFRAGGHSLLATRLVARLRALLGAPVPLRTIFEAPSPRELAAALAALEPAPADVPAEPVAGNRAPGVPLPLSPVQQRLWFLEQLEPGGSTWHLHWLLRLRGPLDRAALAAAFTAVVERHEALRTVFSADAGVPAQLVAPPATVAIEVHAGPAGPTEWLTAFVARPFDLRHGPLLRVGLVADGPQEHRLLVVIHHLVADGWSFANLARDLGAAYAAALAGRPPVLPPLPLQYADYALWQAEALRAGRLAADVDWWRDTLRGAPPLLDLGGGVVAAAGSAGKWTTRTVPAAVLAAVKALAAEEGATPFMLLQAAFAAVLGRLGATTDVVVGTPVAARPSGALEELIGFFVNTLVLRTDLAGEPTFRQLLRRVRRGTLEAFDHADVPFEKLVEALRPDRSLAHTPLVQVLFALHNQPRVPLALPGLEVAVETVANDTVKFDLNLHAAEEEGGLHLALAWRAGLYGAAAMEALLDHYTDLLTRVASQPDATLAELLAGVSVPPRRGRAAARPAGVAADAGAPPPAMPTATEAGLLDLWGGLLGIAVPGPDADFFALGGHSLLATRVIAGIAARFGVELPLLAVFEAPTVRGLAARVDARRAAGATGVAPIRRLPRQPDAGDPP